MGRRPHVTEPRHTHAHTQPYMSSAGLDAELGF